MAFGSPYGDYSSAVAQFGQAPAQTQFGGATTAASNDPFGLYLIDNSYDQPRTGATVTQDIVTQRQDVGGNADAWGGFWLKAAGSVLDYGIKRDAAMLGAELQAQQTSKQPTYAPAVSAGAGGLTVSPMMLIMGAVVAAVVLSK